MESDPDDVTEMFKTPHTCALCEEELYLTEELVLIQVVYPNFVVDHLECYDIDDGAGGYEYEPYFLHLDCWESLMEELDELTTDQPPLMDPLAVVDCSHCKSGIRVWETSCLVTPGELHASNRVPQGTNGIQYSHCFGEPQLLCVACAHKMNEEVFDMWGDDFSHNGECDEGTYRRCWRGNECADLECPCPKEIAC